jgi:hypothetical protein
MSKKKLIYSLKKGINESDKSFFIRESFISSLHPKTDKELNIISLYSHILINKLFLKCSYNEKIEKKLKKYLEKFKPSFLKNFLPN